MTTTTSPTERVGRYQLLEPIGIGPSGEVSRAKVFGVAGFERQFAVKRFHAELTATAALAAMMSAAARAYGSLEHPRIARMSEFGVAQGATFTAVEYVVGIDALRLISEARLAGVTLAAGGALALVSQAARAVGYAHGRGLTHLGLAPTNVIVTADGDIKITDFGLLSATLPPRPIEAPRLAQRIPYLAPEQLANEATSAATDVFALGVLAYELVTGIRTFRGDTPQQVASAIMAGPPGEPPLPRPIVRVLQRCLARSPFERFPDARAMADALDAALRVAPVPGTRKDIGAQVKETLDRLAALNEGQMSGVVALHLGTGPVRRLDDDDLRRAAAGAPAGAMINAPGGAHPGAMAGAMLNAPGDMPAYELGRPDTQNDLSGAAAMAGSGPSSGPAAGPGSGPGATPGSGRTAQVPPMPAPATTLPDLPRQPMTTVPGLAPPPIPVPAGVSGPPSSPQSVPPGSGTLLGIGKSPAGIPPIKTSFGSSGTPPGTRPGPRPGTAPLTRPPAVPNIPPRAGTRPGDPIAIAPAAPSAQRSAAQDGSIQTLDPSEFMSIDSGINAGIGDAVELDAIDDQDPNDHDELGGDTAASPVRAAAPGPLFDPADRPSEPAMRTETELDPHRRRTVDHDDDESDDHRAQTVDPRADTAEPSPGQTMPGFASPRQVRSAAAPAPPPPQGTARPDRPSRAETSDEASLAADTADPTTREPAAPAQSAPIPPTPRPAMPPGWVTAPPPATPPVVPGQAAPGRGRGLVLGLIGAAVLGVGGWQIYARVIAPVRPGDRDAHPIAAAPGDATPASPDAAKLAIASAARDAGSAIAPSGDAARLAAAASDAASNPASDAASAVATAPGDAATPDAPKLAAVPADAASPDAPKLAAAAIDAATPDAPKLAAVPADAATPDAPKLAAVIVDAGGPSDARRAPGDAAQVAATKPPIAPAAPGAAPGDTLAIASTPPGARVFLDGADAGATPVKLAGSPDRHTMALMLAGHELYVAQVDGHGTFQVSLKEVTPTNGPAGIKVLRCKDTNRYYVFVDGKPTGQTCPTERIGCEVGPHTVEVYDAVSETRHKWDIVVKDTRLSFRVRVE